MSSKGTPRGYNKNLILGIIKEFKKKFTMQQVIDKVMEKDKNVPIRSIQTCVSRDLVKYGYIKRMKKRLDGNIRLYKFLTMTPEKPERKTRSDKGTKVPAATPHDTEEKDVLDAYEFGKKIIIYINQLKSQIRDKEVEFNRFMGQFKEQMKDKENTVRQLNKRITELNKQVEFLQSKVKRIPGGREKGTGEKVFRMSEVAHIK